MTTEKRPGMSRRHLLTTAAIGVPAMGVLAATNVLGAAPANAKISVDGWWGGGTTEAFKRFLCQVVAPGAKVRDKGRIQSQPASTGDQSPGLTPDGWDWVPDEGAHGSEVVDLMQYWLGAPRDGLMGPTTIRALQSHYGLTMDGVLDGPSPAITALQEELARHGY